VNTVKSDLLPCTYTGFRSCAWSVWYNLLQFVSKSNCYTIQTQLLTAILVYKHEYTCLICNTKIKLTSVLVNLQFRLVVLMFIVCWFRFTIHHSGFTWRRWRCFMWRSTFNAIRFFKVLNVAELQSRLSHLVYIHEQIKQHHWCKQRHVLCARMRCSSKQVFRLAECYIHRWTLQCSPGNIEILSLRFSKIQLHHLTVCKNISAWKYKKKILSIIVYRQNIWHFQMISIFLMQIWWLVQL